MCPGTPTHCGAYPLLGEDRAAPSPASCLGWLGCPREQSRVGCLPAPLLVQLSKRAGSPGASLRRRRGKGWRPAHCQVRDVGQGASPCHSHSPANRQRCLFWQAKLRSSCMCCWSVKTMRAGHLPHIPGLAEGSSPVSRQLGIPLLTPARGCCLVRQHHPLRPVAHKQPRPSPCLMNETGS